VTCDPPLTAILARVSDGDEEAVSQLLELVYNELRGIARARMAHLPPGQTLQPTALVNEAYVRMLGGVEPPSWQSRGHFFATAARAMHNVLVDQARARSRLKRGGGERPLSLSETLVEIPEANRSIDVLALDLALQKLEQLDERKWNVVMLRVFTGLTMDEAALSLGVSKTTVERDWRFAKAWLQYQLDGSS